MKKLMIAFAAVAFAVGANAAQVAWKIQNIAQYGTTDTKITKANAGSNYLILAMYSADGTISATFDGGKFDAGADKIVGEFTVAGTGGSTSLGKKLEYDYVQGTYYYAVLLNTKADASKTAFNYYGLSTTLTGDPVAASPAVPLELTWTAEGGYMNTYTPVDVPEPTSAMLLLLGVAGLALRRRRA